MKLHEKLKANRRERKAMLKRYNDLKGQIPFFAEDPLVDSEWIFDNNIIGLVSTGRAHRESNSF